MKDDTPRYSDFSEDTVRRLRSFFAVALICTLIAEFFTYSHAYFGIDGTPFFYAWYALAACVGLVTVALVLGRLLKRNEGYYEEGS